MAVTHLKGNPVNTCGDVPAVGSQAPGFCLVANDLSEVKLADFVGKTVVLSIFPSVDTPVCATSVKKFNERAAAGGSAVILNVSRDLPFAQKRFCGAEGISDVQTLSAFRCDDFGKQYGVTIAEGPFQALFARALLVINGEGKVVYSELVNEVAEEPNYDGALAAV
jgi:thioredoxin-dependent peroxiredoxin